MELIGIQTDIVWHDVPANLARADALIAGADPPPGSLVVLPEMFATGFSMDLSAALEGEDRPVERHLADLARRRGCTILGGLATRGPDGRGRNEAVAFGPAGQTVARFTKLHSFGPAGETGCFTPGDRVVTFAWGHFTVCPFICYDLRFPEVFRLAVRRGANLFVVIANWPAERQAHWRALTVARAIENQAYLLAVNRCGVGPSHSYAGGSLLLDPWGNILADAGANPGAIRARPDLKALRDYRQRLPALADIRPDALSVEEEV